MACPPVTMQKSAHPLPCAGGGDDWLKPRKGVWLSSKPCSLICYSVTHKSQRSKVEFYAIIVVHTHTHTQRRWQIHRFTQNKALRVRERECYDTVKFNLKVPLETLFTSHSSRLFNELFFFFTELYREQNPHLDDFPPASVLQHSLTESILAFFSSVVA